MNEQESFITNLEQPSTEIEEIVVGPGLRVYSQRSIPDTLEDIKFLRIAYPEMFIDREGISSCIDREWLIEQIKPTTVENTLFTISSKTVIVKEPLTFDERTPTPKITHPILFLSS